MNKEFGVIEEGIPVPPRKRKYPQLYDLQPGQSVLLDGIREGTIRGIVYQISKLHNRKFRTQEQSSTSIRVWRVQ